MICLAVVIGHALAVRNFEYYQICSKWIFFRGDVDGFDVVLLDVFLLCFDMTSLTLYN